MGGGASLSFITGAGGDKDNVDRKPLPGLAAVLFSADYHEVENKKRTSSFRLVLLGLADRTAGVFALKSTGEPESRGSTTLALAQNIFGCSNGKKKNVFNIIRSGLVGSSNGGNNNNMEGTMLPLYFDDSPLTEDNIEVIFESWKLFEEDETPAFLFAMKAAIDAGFSSPSLCTQVCRETRLFAQPLPRDNRLELESKEQDTNNINNNNGEVADNCHTDDVSCRGTTTDAVTSMPPLQQHDQQQQQLVNKGREEEAEAKEREAKEEEGKEESPESSTTAISMFHDMFHSRLLEVFQAAGTPQDLNPTPEARTRFITNLVDACIAVARHDYAKVKHLAIKLATVDAEHYNIRLKSYEYCRLGKVLLWTLKHCLLDLFNDNVEESWAKAYSRVLLAVMPMAKGTEMEKKLTKQAKCSSKKSTIVQEEAKFRRRFMDQRSRSRESSSTSNVLADVCPYDLLGEALIERNNKAGGGGGGGRMVPSTMSMPAMAAF